jgi:hypothetical protein
MPLSWQAGVGIEPFALRRTSPLRSGLVNTERSATERSHLPCGPRLDRSVIVLNKVSAKVLSSSLAIVALVAVSGAGFKFRW